MTTQVPNIFRSLLMALGDMSHEKGFSPKARTGGNHKSGMTRRGATHKVNPTFRSKPAITVTLNTGERVHPTPALFRRLHLGSQKAKKVT